MGLIGRWIDEKCAREPAAMRRVLNRKFGDLGNYRDPDGTCGCLIGSYELAGGTEERDDYGVGVSVWELTMWGQRAREFERKRPDAFVIRLLKQRIRRALGMTQEVACPARGR